MRVGPFGRCLIAAVVLAALAEVRAASPEACPPDPRGIVPGCPVQPVTNQPVDQAEGADQGAQIGQREAREHPNDAALLAIEEALRSLVREITPSEEDETKTAEEEQRAKDDLNAQQDMAKWALGMLVVAVAQLILTTIGIWLVWQTLRATRDAVKEAEEATKVAADSVAVSRTVGQAQVRCYPSIQNVEIGFRITHVAKAASPDEDHALERTTIVNSEIYFEILNFGQSPALDVFWRTSTKYTVYAPTSKGSHAIERQSERNFPLKEQSPDEERSDIIPAGETKRFNSGITGLNEMEKRLFFVIQA